MSEMSADRPVDIPSEILLSWLEDLDDSAYDGKRSKAIHEEWYMEQLRNLLTQHGQVRVIPA